MVARSRSPYWFESGLFYNDLASPGQWDNTVGHGDIIANDESGVFDYFYSGNNGAGITNSGAATMRIDGFDWMSLSADQVAGSTNTVEIVKPATGWNELKLNVDQVSLANGDNVKVELLDATSGNPISGFTQAEADAITSPGTAVIASWNGNTSLKSITSNLKVKFYFTKTTNAPRLYQYKLTQGTNPTSTSPKTEAKTNPAGVSLTPTLSWTFSDPDTGDSQKAYQVQIASSKANLDAGVADIYDSGKVVSTSSSWKYGSPPLTNETVYWWKVRTWDQVDNPSSYSDDQTFATASAITTITSIIEGGASDVTRYLARYLSPSALTEQAVQQAQEQIDKLLEQLQNTRENIINKPFGLPKPLAYPMMFLSLLLNLVWILRIAITKTAPFIP